MNEQKIMDISSESQFEEVLQSEKPTLVDFWAPWCGPCRAMMPILSNIAKQNAEHLNVVKVNIDQFPTISSTYNIRGIPHCILFEKSNLLGSLTGLQSQRVFEEFLNEHLKTLEN